MEKEKDESKEGKSKIKVVIPGVRGQFDSSVGSGIPKYMYEMYNRMKNLDSIKIEKLEYNRLPLNNRLPFLNALSFRINSALTDFNRYDIVHNLDPGNSLPLYRIKIPIVTTINDLMPLISPEAMLSVQGVDGISSLVKQPALKAVLRLNYQATVAGLKCALKSDFLIANSTQTKEEAVRFGYDKNRIFITWIGLDERYSLAKKLKPNKNKRKFIIGYIGALGYRRNVNLAIDAFRLMDGDDVEFQIWGRRTLESHELDEKASKDKRIRFMGFAPEEKIIEIYDSFDVFVFPSVYEGFGRPILEAQARGLPVVIYKNSRIPKEVRKYCFEAEDKAHMAQIIDQFRNDGYDPRRQEKSIEHARSFTWERTIKKTMEVYYKIV